MSKVTAMTSYQPKALPIDDDGFVRSFALGDDHQMCPDALAFFAEQGFVVVNAVSRCFCFLLVIRLARAQPLGGQVNASS